jgi:hypothetical protein
MPDCPMPAYLRTYIYVICGIFGVVRFLVIVKVQVLEKVTPSYYHYHTL